MRSKRRSFGRRYFGVMSYFVFMFVNLIFFQNCKEQGYSINTKAIDHEKNTAPIKDAPTTTASEDTPEMIKEKICKDTQAPQIAFKNSEYQYYQNQIAFDIDVPNLATVTNPHAAIKSVSCRYKHLKADNSYENFSNIDCQLINEKVNLTFANTAIPFRQLYFEIAAINDCGKSKVMVAKVNSTVRYLQTTNEKLRFIFVVDNSGSNYPEWGSTDPDRLKRYNAMKDFKDIFSLVNTNISFDFIEFGGAIRYFQKSTGIFNFDYTTDLMNLTDFGTAIDFFKNDSYVNHGTKFSIALAATHDVIKENIALDSTLPVGQRAGNFIFFLSDGNPAEYDTLAMQNNRTIDEWAANYLNSYLQFSDIDQNGLSLSTLYYGSASNANAAGLMESLAKQGNGKFFNASASQSFDLQGLVKIPAEIIDDQQ